MNRRWARCKRLLRGAQVAGLGLLVGCASVQRLSRQATNKLLREPPWRSVEIGLCQDYPEQSRSLAHAREDLAAARAAGAKVLRVAFPWDAMEPQRGVYDWSFWDELVLTATDEFGLRLIPYVCSTPKWAARDPGDSLQRSPRDPADFGRFVGALVAHYRASIHSWELWNEPDDRTPEVGLPADYAALIRAGSAAVREADPTARVVLGGRATERPFLEKMLREPGVAAAVDVVNLGSSASWRPDSIESLPADVNRAAKMVRTGGPSKPLWMAGTDYHTAGSPAKASDVDPARFEGEQGEAAQAATLARTLLVVLHDTPVELVAWYRINDLPTAETMVGDGNQRRLGIRRANGEPKLAAVALAQLTRIFAEPFNALKVPVKTIQRTGAEPVVCAFEFRSGRYVIAAWLGPAASRRNAHPEPVADMRRARVTVKLPVPVHIVALSDALAQPLPAGRVTAKGAVTTFELQGSEMLLCVAEP